MDYSTFKSLQLLLFFGSAMGFCLWQLGQLRRLRRERAQGQQKMEGRATPAAEAAVQQAVALTRGGETGRKMMPRRGDYTKRTI
jgi:hypothetical protein